jgi:hypothetical protein
MVGVTFGKFVTCASPLRRTISRDPHEPGHALLRDGAGPVQAVTITLPEIGGRYMSMHVVSQDHYCFVESKPGTYKLTEDTVGTRFAYVTVRTFYNAGDPDDLAKAHAAQDKIDGQRRWERPVRGAELGHGSTGDRAQGTQRTLQLGFDTTYAFGTKEEVRPVDHLGRRRRRLGRPAAHGRLLHWTASKKRRQDAACVTVKDVPWMRSGPSRSTMPTGISRRTRSAGTVSTTPPPRPTRTARTRYISAGIPRA